MENAFSPMWMSYCLSLGLRRRFSRSEPSRFDIPQKKLAESSLKREIWAKLETRLTRQATAIEIEPFGQFVNRRQIQLLGLSVSQVLPGKSEKRQVPEGRSARPLWGLVLGCTAVFES